MTPLKAAILRTLKTDGPLSDLGLWGKVKDSLTGGMAAVVVMACIELENEKYIQAPSNDPHTWELSTQGLDWVTSQAFFFGATHAG